MSRCVTATAILKLCVAEPPFPSSICNTTLCKPPSEKPGLPIKEVDEYAISLLHPAPIIVPLFSFSVKSWA